MTILFMKRTLLASIFAFALFLVSPQPLQASTQQAVFAGGCFWCLEHDLEGLRGVKSVGSGYTGGDLLNPSYSNHKGHQEAVSVTFDPEKISYKKLLRVFWRNIDPLDGDGQFCDRGDSYRPVIFTLDESQRNDAIISSELAALELDKSIESLKVDFQDLNKFWIAEDYHQDFATRNNIKYKFYRYSCGRDDRLEELWGERARSAQQWPN